jgi:hypothetical protein
MLPVRADNEKRVGSLGMQNSQTLSVCQNIDGKVRTAIHLPLVESRAIFCVETLKKLLLVAKQWMFGFPFSSELKHEGNGLSKDSRSLNIAQFHLRIFNIPRARKKTYCFWCLNFCTTLCCNSRNISSNQYRHKCRC